MTPAEFNVLAAGARARAVLAGIGLDAADLEPPHPAFTGFRRMTYLWEEGLTSYPIGDRVGAWLDFLRERSAATAWVTTDATVLAIAVEHPGAADVWAAGELEGAALLRGSAHQSPVQRAAASCDVAVESEQLASAAAAAVATTSSPVDRDSLLRAVTILGSPGDGADASDVAWPYFLLPEAAFTPAARRLLAAAAAAWTCPEASAAAVCAVNGGLAGSA